MLQLEERREKVNNALCTQLMKAMNSLQKGLCDSLAAQRAVSDAERSLIAEGLSHMSVNVTAQLPENFQKLFESLEGTMQRLGAPRSSELTIPDSARSEVREYIERLARAIESIRSEQRPIQNAVEVTAKLPDGLTL